MRLGRFARRHVLVRAGVLVWFSTAAILRRILRGERLRRGRRRRRRSRRGGWRSGRRRLARGGRGRRRALLGTWLQVALLRLDVEHVLPYAVHLAAGVDQDDGVALFVTVHTLAGLGHRRSVLGDRPLLDTVQLTSALHPEHGAVLEDDSGELVVADSHEVGLVVGDSMLVSDLVGDVVGPRAEGALARVLQLGVKTVGDLLDVGAPHGRVAEVLGLPAVDGGLGPHAKRSTGCRSEHRAHRHPVLEFRKELLDSEGLERLAPEVGVKRRVGSVRVEAQLLLDGPSRNELALIAGPVVDEAEVLALGSLVCDGGGRGRLGLVGRRND